MGYYSYTLVERTPEGSTYFVGPSFTPRKVDPEKIEAAKKKEFDLKAAGKAGEEEYNALKANKAQLLEKLNYGRGNMTLQEWDDFLADLVEMNIITDSERFYANGISRDVPEASMRPGGYTGPGGLEKEWDQLWQGDPVKWLNDADVYMLKYQLYGNLDGYAISTGGQRAAYMKLMDIIKEICE